MVVDAPRCPNKVCRHNKVPTYHTSRMGHVKVQYRKCKKCGQNFQTTQTVAENDD